MKYKKLLNDNYASIVPIAIALMIIIIGGLLIGICTLLLEPVTNSDNNINNLMNYLWLAIPVIILLVTVFWSMAQGQRAR